VPVLCVVAMILLSLGYQLHFSINSAPFYLRFAKPTDLQRLMPVFWIGFNIAMFPASVVVKHRGALTRRPARRGGGDGRKPQHADRRAVRRRRGLRLHAVTGLMFSAPALATTFARTAAAAGGLQKLPEYAPLLHWAPIACWSVAGCGLLVNAAARVQQRAELRRA
jgi:hypothetical protein